MPNTIKNFITKWTGRGNEIQDTSKYWIDLLSAIGVSNPTDIVNYEKYVFVNGKKKRIDVFMPDTKVLVEQKSINIDLDKPELQSDGAVLTPYEQGKRYSDNLPFSEKPSRIIVCNFKEIRIHDMNQMRPELDPVVIKLEDLEKEAKYLDFLKAFTETAIRKEEQISVDAGNIVKKLYNLLLAQYADPDEPETLKSLNILCVRLVFMMYCEDSGIFEQNQFKNYVIQFRPAHLRRALKDLFIQLDIPEAERDPYLSEDIASFPYVNGGLFREHTEIPNFTDEILDELLEAMDFDWASISAPIFGACYEGTINPETRHQNGMHYTKTEDVAKLLDNLFLDDLRAELSTIKAEPVPKKRKKALKALQIKLSKIGVADFAAGSGNFGVEAYLGLRRIENEILQELNNGQIMLDVSDIDDAYDPIKVSIGQIHLAEINDFAADVARVSLWIAEAQMLRETESIIHRDIDYFPLSTEAHIITCDSLTTPWEEIVPKNEISYIVQNPPYLGYSLQTKEQKEALKAVYVDENGKPYKTAGKIDYVAGWMFKAAEYIQGTNIRCAFVTTNSVTQGEQVAAIWKPLYERFGIHIDFAYRTFKWNNGTKDMAAVHVVIFGFSCVPRHKNHLIYPSGSTIPVVANNINPYLVDAPNVFIESRKKPLCDVPEMTTGNRPADGGHLIIEANDYNDFIQREPEAEKYIKKLVGSDEYINNRERYCLWLVDCSPAEIMRMPLVMQRVEACREDRLNGAPDRQKLANTPTVFRETKNPDSYLIIPATSSENRSYIPIGFEDGDAIPTNALIIIPDATPYLFGVLTSSMHMAWMRAVAGRLEMRYRYSKDVVYNNFPWPHPTAAQRVMIEVTAQEILDARAKYPDASLADMYGEKMYLFTDLVKAHDANDKAVMAAYGIKPSDPAYTDEAARVAFLMNMYQKLVEEA